MSDLVKTWPCEGCADLVHFTPGGVAGGPPLDPPYSDCGRPSEDCGDYRAAAELGVLADATAYAIRLLRFSTADAEYRKEFAERVAEAFSDLAQDHNAELDRDEFLRRAIPLMERKPESKT